MQGTCARGVCSTAAVAVPPATPSRWLQFPSGEGVPAATREDGPIRMRTRFAYGRDPGDAEGLGIDAPQRSRSSFSAFVKPRRSNEYS